MISDNSDILDPLVFLFFSWLIYLHFIDEK